MIEPTYTFFNPVYAGCWEITESFHVYVKEKPNWLHRKMSKLMLGWEWRDGDYN